MKKNSIVVLPLIAAAVIAFGCGGAGQSAGHGHKFGGDCCTIRSTPGSDPIAQEWTAGTQFNPDIAYGTLNDKRDGKTYRTVKIGNLVWMAENLNYQTNGSRCRDNCEKYGRLYGWDVAKNACPAGWRMPFEKDWVSLRGRAAKFVSSSISLAERDSAVAAVLSSAKKDFWKGRGTDSLGFSALPGASLWWCGDEFDDGYLFMGVSFRDEYKYATFYSKKDNIDTFSLRCVQDNPDAAPPAPAESESAPPGAN